jgi:LAS superfamily LD-carboxypeptidase LdcB
VRALIGCLLVLLLSTGSARAADTSRHATGESRPAKGYRNGRPFPIRLVEVDGKQVEARTAKAFRAMQSAAARDGIQLVIRSGFRAHEKQKELYRKYRAGRGNPAARPGYSNHQSGTALDIIVRDPATLAWMEKNGPRFGFHRTVRSEPWHWELQPRTAAKTVAAAR